MATYYAATTGSDGNAGSIGSPWRHLAYAGAQLSAGDTLYIRGGTYTDTLDRFDNEIVGVGGTGYSVPSGTDFTTGAITISAYPSETVILQPSDQQAIRLVSGVTYVIFQDLILDGQFNVTPGHLDGPDLVYVAGGSNHNRFQNIEAKNNAASGYQISYNNGSADYNEILGGSSHDNGALAYGNSGYGIYLKTSNNLIQGVDIYGNNGYGIHLNASATHGNNNQIIGNWIHGNVVHGVPTAGGATSYGVALLGGGAPGPTGNLIANNLIYENQGGVFVYTYATDTLIENNTITGNLGHGGGGEYAVQMQYHGTGTIIRNNIIYSNANGPIQDDGDILGAFGTYTADHNTTSDPGFVNAGTNDYHLAAASGPAYDTGSSSVVVADDFDGTARPQGGSYDMGAYEFIVAGVLVPVFMHHFRQQGMA